MGLNISLNLTPTITPEQWESFWNETLELLQKFPLPLVRATKQKTSYGIQRVWTKTLTSDNMYGEYWEIQGDTESLVYGEPFRLYRDFTYYQKRNRVKSTSSPVNDDPLFCTPESFKKTKGLVPLGGFPIFNEPTQGFPYHHAIAAVVALAEYRFPKLALGWGELRPIGCEMVESWLSDLYDEDIPGPICLDAPRLWNRIEGVCGDIETTMNRFDERFLGTPAQKFQRMLAESKEATLQKLAGDLLEFDTVTMEFRDTAKYFLDATDDLEMFLDIVELRNTMAKNENESKTGQKTEQKKQHKKTKPRKYTIIPLEDVLAMLVKGFVTWSQWQGENIRTVNRWIGTEGNINQMASTALLRKYIPVVFDYYCSEKDLLEAFVRREPDKEETFRQALAEALLEAEKAEEGSQRGVAFMRNLADEHFAERAELEGKSDDDDEDEDEDEEDEDDGDEEDEESYDFDQFITDEARSQGGLFDPLIEQDIVQVAQYFGRFTDEMIQRIKTLKARGEVKDGEDQTYLLDPTGKKQLAAIEHLTYRHDVHDIHLSEEVIQELESTDDVELLTAFSAVAPFLLTPQFRDPRAPRFEKEFEKMLPRMWHILNKPIWWKTFGENLRGD